MIKLIVILGQTATGKTELAVKLAAKFKAEIISADSRQIYKDMQIGTGQDLKKYKHIPYHLINLIPPNQQFSLAEYQKKCLQKIKQVQARGKLPFLVGGTGLYISAVVDNYQIPAVKPDPRIKAKLAKLNKKDKIKMLKKLDNAALNFVDIDNPRRLERALEVCLSGQKFSESRKKNKSIFNILQIGIKKPRQKLNSLIDQRVNKMIKQGLINETKKIIKKYGLKSIPLQTIGYAEIIDYLNKKTTLSEAVELIKIHTHQLAKRQMAWFKRDKHINWITNYNQAEKLISNFLK